MIRVLRSELYRTLSIRSNWVSIAATIALGFLFGTFSVDFWALFAGLGAFAIASMTTAQHYQHRTAILLFLGEPHRLRTLAAQCVAAAAVTTATAALSGLVLLATGGDGDSRQFRATLTAVPVLAVFSVAVATVVRRPTWLLVGAVAWVLFVEGLIGKLRYPLPFSTYLTASTGRSAHLLIFAAWTAAALAAAAFTVRRDLTGD